MQLTPKALERGPVLGVYISEKYHFPFPVKVQLQDVGGPSAGMMFALGIIDKLTPGELNGGKHVAGTGTITRRTGWWGPSAASARRCTAPRTPGRTYFLAPASNCGGDEACAATSRPASRFSRPRA